MPVSAPPPNPVEEPGTFVTRFGAVVGLAVAAAAACSVPAAVRVARSLPGVEGAVEQAWFALAAASLPPMLAAVMVLRAAREGLRAFGGPGAQLRITVSYSGLPGSWPSSRSLEARCGGQRTNMPSRVTYALGAVVLALGVGIVCVRIVAILRGARGEVRRAAGIALGAVSAGVLAWNAGVGFSRAVTSDPASASASGMVLDLLAFILAAFLASRRSVAAFAIRRTLALVGPPIAVALVALGLAALKDGALVAAIRERAPAYAPTLDVVAPP